MSELNEFFEDYFEGQEQKKIIGKRSLNTFDSLKINDSNDFHSLNENIGKIFELLTILKIPIKTKDDIYEKIIKNLKRGDSDEVRPNK